MIKKISRADARKKRHYRLRNTLSGTVKRPRLAVFRSNSHIYAQIIDDVAGHTLVAASTMEKDIAANLKAINKHTSTVEAAKVVGEAVAKKALAAGINEVVFDRGGFIYHGKVKTLADAARDAGLKF